jgi:hypothetical protein
MIDYLSYIPKKFSLGAQEYEVKIVDHLDDENYGEFSYTPPELRVARYTGDERIPEKQMLASYFHELVHCMDYMFDCTTDEAHAQCFSNFMMEYIESKQ